MEPAKSFNNVILGQFVLTGVPIKVYINGMYLTITDIDDVEDPSFGFGMDENGDMQRFDYRSIDQLLVSGNVVTLDTYNKGMGAEEESTEEPAEEEPKKEESIMNLKQIIKEISAEEVEAEMEAAQAEIDAAKAKEKAAKAAVKDTIKSAKDKIKAAKASMKVAEEGIVKEGHMGYTFGVGDIVKNQNKSCPHHGSMGVVKKLMDLPNNMGTVVLYTVTNDGPTFKSGDVLAKTMDQLEPIQKPDGLEDMDELNVRDEHGDEKIENPKTGKKIKFSSALKAPKGTAVYNKARKRFNRLKDK